MIDLSWIAILAPLAFTFGLWFGYNRGVTDGREAEKVARRIQEIEWYGPKTYQTVSTATGHLEND